MQRASVYEEAGVEAQTGRLLRSSFLRLKALETEREKQGEKMQRASFYEANGEAFVFVKVKTLKWVAVHRSSEFAFYVIQ